MNRNMWISLVWISLVLIASPLGAEDWPQWRGPDRTGVAAGAPPEPWPKELRRAWRLEVGEGHASPVVVGGRVYAFTREADSEVLRAVDLASGDVLWRAAYEAPYRMNPAATSHGPGPKSTPLVASGKVFTLGIAGRLSAFDAETGRVVWQNDFRDRFPTRSPLYGHATSPLLAGGKLVVHLGGPANGALLALEPNTGEILWAHEGDGPGYTSPMAYEIAGRVQVVTQTDAHIVGVGLDSGELLWSLPFETPYDQNIFTTIRHGDRLVVSGLDQATMALTVAGDEPREAWSSRATFYMSTPVLTGDRLVGFSDKRSGQFVALDASSGEIVWQSEGREGENAAVVAWGDWILLLTDGAELFVVPADASSFAPIRTYDVADSPTWAHPVPTGSGILVKDLEHLTLWALE